MTYKQRLTLSGTIFNLVAVLAWSTKFSGIVPKVFSTFHLIVALGCSIAFCWPTREEKREMERK